MNKLFVDPKVSQAIKKICFNSVPITSQIIATFGADVGAIKYGLKPWLALPNNTMSMMTYINALKRHVILFEAGQDRASDCDVHHLDLLISGLNIVRDAMIFGKVQDDRVKLTAEQIELLEKILNKEIKI